MQNKEKHKPIGENFFEETWKESWTHVQTVVDLTQDPLLILDGDLTVIAANETFYETFQVSKKETLRHPIHTLGNGQWNIPDLLKLLKDIFTSHSYFKGFEVSHDFPSTGRKVMMLHGRQIHIHDKGFSKDSPPLALLAMDDITELVSVAHQITDYTSMLETRLEKQSKSSKARLEKILQKQRSG